MRKSCKKQPMSCGFNPSDDAYEPLKLMQSVILKTNEICLRYLDNSMLCSLPSPGPPYNLVNCCAIKNSRRRMEDRHVVVHDLNTIFNDQEASPSSYYAVFDGHAGHDAAAYSAAHLHQYLAESKYFACNPEQALIDAFCRTDKLFIDKCKVESFSSGTTAVCALVRPKEKSLYIAWVGDSQALLANQGRILQCVNPHKPGRKDERERIEKLGGIIIYWGTWRVNGQLAVSRAIGDFEYKPYVIAVPDVREIPLTGTEDFLILACDGLWDCLSEEDAATVVYKMVYDNPDNIESISQRLVQLSKEQGSTDNISVIVVFLREPSKIAAEAQWAARAARTSSTTAMEAGLDNANAANPFTNSNGAEILVQKDSGFLLSLDGYKPPTNGEDYFMEHSTNGKRTNDEFDEDEDMGPETDVDALDDVAAPIASKPIFDPFNDKLEFQLNSAQDLTSQMDKHFGDTNLHGYNHDEMVNSADSIEEKQQENEAQSPEMEKCDLMESINAQMKFANKDDEEKMGEDEKQEKEPLEDKIVAEMDMYFKNHTETAMREETPTPPADEVHDAGLVDNVADSGDDSEDEWNYIKGDTEDKENICPSQPDQEVADINRDREEEDVDNMSQLNPDAAEFVPISPTRSIESPACRALKDEQVLAQSPKRSNANYDIDINLPDEKDFDREVKNRPSEVFSNGHENGHKMSSQEIMENLLNGKNIDEIEFQPNSTPVKVAPSDEFHFGPNATPFSTPGKFLDQSEALSTKANFGDDSTASYMEDKENFPESSSNNPFGDQSSDNTDFQLLNKEQDPMSMSFYQDKEEGGNPFDLNQVQMLPDDVDDFIQKPQVLFNETIANLTEESPVTEKGIITTDLDKKEAEELLGVSELPKSPIHEAKTPEPSLDENLCSEKLIASPEPIQIEDDLSAKSPVSEPLEDFSATSPEPISDSKSPEPVHIETTELVCTKTPEPDVCMKPEVVMSPSPIQTPEPEVCIRTPEPVMAKTPEPVLAKTPEPEVCVRTPEPELIQNPEPEVCIRTPEPDVCLVTSEPDVCINAPEPDVCMKAPEPDVCIKSPEPEACFKSPEPEVCNIQNSIDDFCMKQTEQYQGDELLGSPTQEIESNIDTSSDILETHVAVNEIIPQNPTPELVAESPEALPEQTIRLECSLPPFCDPYYGQGVVDMAPGDNIPPESPHDDITSSVKDDEPLTPMDQQFDDHMVEEKSNINFAQELSSAMQENIASEISSPLVDNTGFESSLPVDEPKILEEIKQVVESNIEAVSELQVENVIDLTGCVDSLSGDQMKVDDVIDLTESPLSRCVYPLPTQDIQSPEPVEALELSPVTDVSAPVETVVEKIVEAPKEDPSIIPEAAAITAAAAGVVAAAATIADTKPKPASKKTTMKPLSTKSTAKPPAKTATKSATSPPKPLTSPTKPPPISRLAAAKSAAAVTASKAAAAKPAPKVPATKTLAPKTTTEKKPIANGDVKTAAPKTTLAARKPAVPSTTKTATAAPKVPPTRTTRPITAPAKTAAPRPATTLAPKSTVSVSKTTTTTRTTTATSRPLTAPKAATTTRTALSAPRPKPAASTTTTTTTTSATKPRVPISRPAAKAPDAEKQNKENVNKLTASRTTTTRTIGSAAAKTTTTTMTTKKLESKTSSPRTLAKTTTTTMRGCTTAAKKPITDASKNGPIKSTKTTTTKVSKPKENGVANGVTTISTEITTTTEITTNELEPQLLKDLSPIENKLLDNSQLTETIAD